MLDITRYGEVTQQLFDAKQFLIESGWCVGTRAEWNGKRCVLGAADAVVGEHVTAEHAIVIRLADAIPIEFTRTGAGLDHDVAAYNNVQGSIDPILQWIDRAIIGA